MIYFRKRFLIYLFSKSFRFVPFESCSNGWDTCIPFTKILSKLLWGIDTFSGMDNFRHLTMIHISKNWYISKPRFDTNLGYRYLTSIFFNTFKKIWNLYRQFLHDKSFFLKSKSIKIVQWSLKTNFQTSKHRFKRRTMRY